MPNNDTANKVEFAKIFTSQTLVSKDPTPEEIDTLIDRGDPSKGEKNAIFIVSSQSDHIRRCI